MARFRQRFGVVVDAFDPRGAAALRPREFGTTADFEKLAGALLGRDQDAMRAVLIALSMGTPASEVLDLLSAKRLDGTEHGPAHVDAAEALGEAFVPYTLIAVAELVLPLATRADWLIVQDDGPLAEAGARDARDAALLRVVAEMVALLDTARAFLDDPHAKSRGLAPARREDLHELRAELLGLPPRKKRKAPSLAARIVYRTSGFVGITPRGCKTLRKHVYTLLRRADNS